MAVTRMGWLYRRCGRLLGWPFWFCFAAALLLHPLHQILLSLFPKYFLAAADGSQEPWFFFFFLLAYLLCQVGSPAVGQRFSRLIFRYRLEELGELYAVSIARPLARVESSEGQKRLEEAFMAVAGGNSRGVEAQLAAQLKLAQQGLSLLISLVFFVCLGWVYTLIFILCLLAYGAVYLYFQNGERTRQEKYSEAYGREESLLRGLWRSRAVASLRMLGAQKELEGRIAREEEAQLDYFRERERRRCKQALFRQILAFIRGFSSLALVLTQTQLGLGDFLLYLGLFLRSDDSLEQLLTAWLDQREQRTWTEALYRFHVEEVQEPAPQETFDGDYDIVFDQVSFSYPQTPIFERLSFRIPEGARVAVLGANGRGKTTLIKLLCGLYVPDSGEVRIGGRPASEAQAALALAPQNAALFAFSIRENICLGQEREDEEIWQQLEALELASRIRQGGGLDQTYSRALSDAGIELSGGQSQRLILARILQQRRPVLLLDEPTAALDLKAERRLYQLLERQARGHSIIFVSHRLATTRFCEHILFLGSNGPVWGSHEELEALCPEYRDLVRIQAKAFEEELEP